MNLPDHIIFLHIPKTAGVTFSTLLYKNYGLDRVFSIPTVENVGVNRSAFTELKQDQRDKYRVVFGHVDFGLHAYFSGETKYIALLRNPIDRILSYYFYVRNSKRNRRHDEVKNMSFQEFVHSDITKEVDNLQCRMIAGYQTKTELLLCQAIQNVEQYFVFVGIVEFFDESLMCLKEELGWKKIWYTKRNVSRRDYITLTPEIIEIITKKNSLDMMLYDIVLYKFLEKTSRLRNKDLRLLLFKKLSNPLYKNYVQILGKMKS